MKFQSQFFCAVIFLGFISFHSASDISRIGNEIRRSSSGVEVAGATFLLNDAVLTDGVVFAYRAFFRNSQSVRFQIWRPTFEGNEFTLIAQTIVRPSVTFDVEDIYIEGVFSQCVKVKSGDRLGLMFENATGSISYVFQSVNPTAFGKILNNPSTVRSGDNVTFDSLTFPYDFSVAAYIYTADYNPTTQTEYTVECPKVLIPETIDIGTPAPPVVVTGEPGATGATGPQGAAGFPGGEGSAGATGPMGSIGFTGATGPMGNPGPNGVMGATGPYGPAGPVGATGPKGDKGMKGDQGPAGPPGKPMIVDPKNPNNLLPITDAEEEGFLGSSLFSIILLVWLVIVTILCIILIICICCLRKNRRQRDETKYMRDYPEKPYLETVPPLREPKTSTADEEARLSWLGTMKTSSETSYSVETLNTDETKKGRQNGHIASGNGYTNQGADLSTEDINAELTGQ